MTQRNAPLNAQPEDDDGLVVFTDEEMAAMPLYRLVPAEEDFDVLD